MFLTAQAESPQGKSNGIKLTGCSGVVAKNNISNVLNAGAPVYIGLDNTQLDFDYNDYYSSKEAIGYYNGILYTDLLTWVSSLGMDENTLSVIPFYESLTDLSINQILLNNAAIPVNGILVDIDGDPRNPLKPDIGAKEYSLCANDAGINAILSPENPLTGGVAQVMAVLQNQGTATLTSAKINWLVNTDLQTPYSWTGNLAAGANAEVNIGEYDFQNGSAFVLKIWTSLPNNSTDCNHNNDTVYSDELSGSLCGTYTIGGNNPDFGSFSEVAEVLNKAGISCPVTFMLRNGTYFEKLIIREIKGSSEVNTVTFRSESGDSTLAVIQIEPDAAKYESMLYLDKTQHIIFKGLGLFTGSDVSNTNNAILLNGTNDIEFSGCYFESRNASDFGLVIQGAVREFQLRKAGLNAPTRGQAQ